MLLFGCLTRVLDRNKQVVAIRIASDARIFLVATFVLAGAALDIGVVMESWLEPCPGDHRALRRATRRRSQESAIASA
jgi:hypothetical protein